MQLPADVAAAFDVAFDNIHKFHAAQKQALPVEVETMPVRAKGGKQRPKTVSSVERLGMGCLGSLVSRNFLPLGTLGLDFLLTSS